VKTLLIVSLVIYLAGFALWIAGCIARQRSTGSCAGVPVGSPVGVSRTANRLNMLSLFVVIAALIVHTVVIGIRTYYTARLPVSAIGETLLFYSWCVIIATLFVVFRYRERLTGLITIPIGIISLAICFSRWTEPKTLPLILRTVWFEIHVIASFAGYALFSLAFAGAVLYLIRSCVSGKCSGAGSRDGSGEASLEVARTGVVWGFFLFSASMFSGAVWGYLAWGTYWMWEPKILWSFIVWFWFAGTMHAWYIKSWKGRTLAILTILGFAVVGFTYLGVGLLMKSSHSF